MDKKVEVRTHLRAWLLAAAVAGLPAAAGAQTGPPPKGSGPPSAWPVPAPASSPAATPAATGALVSEREPNNSASTATAVSPTDHATGAISPAGDVDYFALDVPAGTTLDVQVFAARSGSPLDPVLYLYTANGATQLEVNDDAFGLDSRIRYHVGTAGRYLFAVRDFGNRGGASYAYRIAFDTVPTPPGDPSTQIAAGLGQPWAAAAGRGDVYVTDVGSGRVLRIVGEGTTVLASGLQSPRSIAVDGFGNVLVAAMEANGGLVQRVLPSGQTSRFVGGLQSVSGLTVGPDGSVWVLDSAARSLIRYDPRGTELEAFPVAGVNLIGVAHLAFSPAGELHLSNFIDGIYRVERGAAQRVWSFPGAGAFAFDRDGRLYVGTPADGILMVDAAYRTVHAPFAFSDLTRVPGVVFTRDAAGAMTSRLMGLNLSTGQLREVNPAGVRAPGHRIGADLLVLRAERARAGIVGADYADTLAVTDSPGALTWQLRAGALPPGIALDPRSGVLSGIPREMGESRFEVSVAGEGRVGSGWITLSVTRPTLSASDAANHLLGVSGVLTPALERFLDLQGNRNGRYDLGDLQAYLRSPEPNR